jgi:hypothetical protein
LSIYNFMIHFELLVWRFKQYSSLSKSSCAPVLARVGSCLRGRCLWSHRFLLFRRRLFWKTFVVSLRITPHDDVSKQSRHVGDEMFSIIEKLHRDLSSILQDRICQLRSIAIMPWRGLCTSDKMRYCKCKRYMVHCLWCPMF